MSASLLLAGCMSCPSVQVELSRCWPEGCGAADAQVRDAGAILPWGTWAARLAVPGCPDGGLLVVNRVDDRLLDAGLLEPPLGASLSLPEAIWIAYNRPGPDTVTFDQAVFPAEAPTTIWLDGGLGFPNYGIDELCLDARNRGVIVEWTQVTGASNPVWGLGQGSLQVGLVLVNNPTWQAAAAAQIAGCRMGTDGTRHALNTTNYTLLAFYSRIGPGNVLTGNAWVQQSSVFENEIGHDPLTGATWPEAFLLRADDPPVTVQNNVISSLRVSMTYVAPFRRDDLTIADNLIGIDRNGQRIPSSGVGVFVGASDPVGGIVIGPGNLITGHTNAIAVEGPQSVQITRNRIWGNARGIVTSALEPPVITQVSGGAIDGTCARPGLIEVFSDRADQGETFLTSTNCTTTWHADVVPQPGRFVTATLTDFGGRDGGGTSAYSAPVAF